MRAFVPLATAMLTLLIPGGAAVAAEHGAAEGPVLVTMKPLDVPIVEGDRSDGRLRLTLVLRAADAAAGARLQEQMPALRETSLATAIEFARLHASPFTPVDAERLVAMLTTSLRARVQGVAAVLLVKVAAVRS